ncbi:MAG: TniQ family protein [Anaerolineae bacterium]|nr:TniQ family protein [Anaerolineae bacterium]
MANSADTSSLLINRPPLMPHESLSSYVYRLAVANYYEPVSMFTGLIRVETNGDRLSIDQVTHPKVYHRLSLLTGIDIENLHRATSHRFAPILTPPNQHIGSLVVDFSVSLPIMSRGISTSHIRSMFGRQFCPLCLKDAAYQRVNWLPMAAAICLEHQCLLVTACPSCGQQIMSEDICQARCKRCLTNLSEAPVISVKHDELGLLSQEVIQSWLMGVQGKDEEYGLPLQSPRTLFRVMDGLRLTSLLPGPEWIYLHRPPNNIDTLEPVNHKKSSLTPAQSYSLFATAFKTLMDWPSNFYAFLDAYQARNGRTQNRVIYDDFGTFYATWLERRWRDSEMIFVQDTFNDYLVEFYPPSLALLRSKRYQADPNFAARIPYIHATEVIHSLRISSRGLRNLIKAGRIVPHDLQDQGRQQQIFFLRDEVLALGQEQESSISQKGAMKLLGINQDVVRGLRDTGLLKVVRGPEIDGYKRYAFSIKATQEFLAFILSHATDMPYNDPQPYVKLQGATAYLSNFRKNAAYLLKCVIDGKLKAYCIGVDERNLSHLCFAVSDIEALKAEINSKRSQMSQKQVRNFLHISNHIIDCCVNEGLIHPIEGYSGDRQSKRYFDKQEILNFQMKYINSAEAASILGVTQLVVQKWTRQGRIKAALTIYRSTGAGQYYFYNKEYLLDWINSRVSFGEARTMLGVSNSTLHEWAKMGRIIPLADMAGKQRWFARKDVLSLIRM